MQVVILAGGLSTRLRPLTDTIPKVLVPVGGRPFLDWLIGTLPHGEVEGIVLLTGYLGEQVAAYCGDGGRYGIPVVCSREPEPLGTAGALRHAADVLAPCFAVVNGDTYLEVDYAGLRTEHRRQGTVATMALARSYDPAIRANVRVESDGRVSRYVKGAEDAALNAIDAGVVSLDRRVLDYIPAEGPSGLETVVFPALIARGELAGYTSPEVYYDIGTPSGLAALERHLRDRAG